MMNKMLRQILLLGIVFVTITFLAGCQYNASPNSGKVGTRAKLLTIIENYKDERNSYYDQAIPEAQIDGISDNQTQSSDYSKTNTQIDGVDEADSVKTDGQTIYSISQGRVLITQATPILDAGITKTLTYAEGFNPVSLYVDEEHLIVIGQNYDNTITSGGYGYYSHGTKILIYDKTDYEEAKQTLMFDGYTVTTRKVENTLLLIINKAINIHKSHITDKEVLPSYSINGDNKTIGYDDLYYQDGVYPNNVVSVFKINLADLNQEFDHYSYIGQSNTIYVSKKNIYLANRLYNYTNNDVNTSVTKVNYQNKLELINTTVVEGSITNQFNMDEYDDNFRITTTKGGRFNDDSTNNLFIYDDKLKLIGSLEGLARGESIQSTRFVGDRVYMVTFKQIDPFFVIDAGDPTKPVLLGELKIPGFSTYLHPYDQNHMIGFGFEGNDDGQITGFKMALYNVSNPSAPIELFKETILYDESGYNHSELTYNHKALLFSLDKNLIGFPITSSNYTTSVDTDSGRIRYDYTYKQEYKVYGLDLEEGFSEKANISHFIEGKTMDYAYLNTISRGLYINNLFYTVSQSKIMVHDLETFELEKIIDLPVIEEPNKFYQYY